MRRAEMLDVHAHASHPYAAPDLVAARCITQLHGREVRNGDVVVKQGEVEPFHVQPAKGFSQREPRQVYQQIIDHAFATESDQRRTVTVGEEPVAPHEARQVLQSVLVADLDYVRTLGLEDAADLRAR